MRNVGLVGLFLLVGCQEYQIGQVPPLYEEPNPPELGNPAVQDRIVQVPVSSADVLWVVDNSGSMSNEQDSLATNFPAFMNYFLGSGLDYHIGVVSTDLDAPAQSGKLTMASTGEKYLTPDSEDPMTLFAQMARLGITGSGTEKGRGAAYMALEILKDTYNAGFLRDDPLSGVHMIVITDEADYTTANQEISKDEFVAWANALRAEDELVTWNSICLPPGVPLDGGDDYVYLTDNIGGIMHDIRQEDWVAVLEALGIQAAGLKREYFLSKMPVVDTIEVKVVLPDGTVIPFQPRDWTYSSARNSVTFDEYLPEPLSEVYIDYTAAASMVDVIDQN
jgi:hypothetical protein